MRNMVQKVCCNLKVSASEKLAILQSLWFLNVQINLIKIFPLQKTPAGGENFIPKKVIAQEQCFPLFLFNLQLTSAVIVTVNIEMLHDTRYSKVQALHTQVVTEVLTAV